MDASTSVDGAGRLLDFGAADALGTLGLLLYIASYLLLQLGLLRGDGYLFPTLNLVAASAVLFSLMEMFNPYSALGEMAWIVISLVGIVRLFIVRRFLRLSPDDAAAARALVPTVAPDRARKLLALGTWTAFRPGEVLTREGEPVAALTVLAEGPCRIEHAGTPVATAGPGALIGEMTYRSGAPATASVLAETEGRLLRIDTARLLPFLKRNPDLDEALELSVAGDLRRKLEATTRHLGLGSRA